MAEAGGGKSRLLYEFRQHLAGKRVTYAVQLPHPGESDLHELRLQSYRLPVQRHGLPYIHLLRQPGEREEVHGELKTIGISGLVEERLGLGGIVPVQLLEALIPVRVPDPRPEITVVA